MRRVVLLVAVVGAVGCGGNNPLRVPVPKDAGPGRDAAVADVAVADVAVADAAEESAVEAGDADTGVVDAASEVSAAAGLCKMPGRAAKSATLDDGTCAQGAHLQDGVCACPTSPPKVCEGRCVDLEMDEDNCGACGCHCGPMQTCNGGLCGRAPQVIVPATNDCHPLSLATGGGLLIWADRLHGTISALATGAAMGGPAMTIATREDAPAQVTFADGAIYWMTETEIRKGGVGAQPTTVVRSAWPIHGFVVSGTSIFYTTQFGVMLQPQAPATEIELVHDEGFPTALALDEMNRRLVYQTAVSVQIGIAAIAGGLAHVAGGRGPLMLPTIIARRGRALWADGNLVRMAETSSPFTSAIVASTSGNPITGMALFGDTVYFSEAGLGGVDGVIYKAFVAPGETSIRIARGLHDPQAVAVDDERVYWSTGDCAIMAKGL